MGAERHTRTAMLVLAAVIVVAALVLVPALLWLLPPADEPAGTTVSTVTTARQSSTGATPTLTPQQLPTVEAPGAAPMPTGRVRANDAVADLQGAVAFGEDQSLDGAVAAFTSTATWLLASPAVRAEPMVAVQGPVGAKLNIADAQLLMAMGRSPGDDFTPSVGVYRVVGHSGAEKSPDQVMVEVAAPATFGTNSRWLIVGGVVSWADGHWNLGSIAPKEIPQPPATITRARDMSASQQATTFPGLGWQYFAPAP